MLINYQQITIYTPILLVVGIDQTTCQECGTRYSMKMSHLNLNSNYYSLRINLAMSGKSIYFHNENAVPEFKEANEIVLSSDWPQISWLYIPADNIWYRTADTYDGTPVGWWNRCFSKDELQPPEHLKLQVLLLKGTA